MIQMHIGAVEELVDAIENELIVRDVLFFVVLQQCVHVCVENDETFVYRIIFYVVHFVRDALVHVALIV